MSRKDDDVFVTPLPNGVRALTLRTPQRQTAGVSVYVRTGSAHESRAENGISHVVEHMVFKGSATRDARRINVDAERLGAEVNAHTDKDHTAFHMRGLARDVPEFVRMLGDIVLQPSFPADELERERQVLLHECTEDEDDALSTAFQLFDRACFGAHPASQAVIGPRRNLERFTRQALVDYVRRQYSGSNLVVAVAGDIDPEAFALQVQAAFGALAPGVVNQVPVANYIGGVATKALSGNSQAHAVLGFPLPPLAQEDPAAAVAAALFGEGMSSPLMDEIRERRGLAYYAACSADVLDCCGQFVIEASTSARQVDELLSQVMRLLAEQSATVQADDLTRARNQMLVRRLRGLERPQRRLEDAVLALFALGRVPPQAERLESLLAVSAEQVCACFRRMLATGPSLALAGQLARGAAERAKALLAPYARAATGSG
jgi:predicted Zn-dependent peptidase